MFKYLLILLILLPSLKTNKAFSQIITISQAGRKIIFHVVPDKHKLTADSSVIHVDSDQLIKTQNSVDYTMQLKLAPTKFIFPPLSGNTYVTSDFGERFHPILQSETLHAGIDLRANYEVVNSIAYGIIVKEGYNTRAGNYIVIQHGNGIESIYCHLSKFLLKPGDLVFAGNSIAISGASGAATGPHLHFAIKVDGKFINPEPLLKAIFEYNEMR
ncbi:MAG: M23 family metallopeptidase [Bacteroidota bacterium]|nr:M23 family metallopeptidase [Bacteroidota bacterium]